LLKNITSARKSYSDMKIPIEKVPKYGWAVFEKAKNL
jgi:hypothetical protein